MEIESTSTEKPGTHSTSIGIQLSNNGSVHSYSVAIVHDRLSNIEIAITQSLGTEVSSGGTSLSITRSESYSNAPNVFATHGEGYKNGGSVSVGFGSLGYDDDYYIDNHGNAAYTGFSVNFGIGVSIPPVEMEAHTVRGMTYGTVFHINLFQTLKGWLE